MSGSDSSSGDEGFLSGDDEFLVADSSDANRTVEAEATETGASDPVRKASILTMPDKMALLLSTVDGPDDNADADGADGPSADGPSEAIPFDPAVEAALAQAVLVMGSKPKRPGERRSSRSALARDASTGDDALVTRAAAALGSGDGLELRTGGRRVSRGEFMIPDDDDDDDNIDNVLLDE